MDTARGGKRESAVRVVGICDDRQVFAPQWRDGDAKPVPLCKHRQAPTRSKSHDCKQICACVIRHGKAYLHRMAKIEHSLALPLRQFTSPLQLGIGAVIAAAGAILALSHL